MREVLNSQAFGADFAWGVSTAAFQTEGACNSDGKGLSIWDIFTSRKGKIRNSEHADIACDFYNRYADDIKLISQLNIPNFRFSIAWTRLLPNGFGQVNQKGIDYYNRVIDQCLKLNINPWLTLYHWDLPAALEQKGGWTNRDSVSWFADYTALCAKHFGDRVKHWMVMNEPAVFTGAGYFFGVHAPGRRGLKNFLPALHHVILGMAEGGRTLRASLPSDAEIGSTFSCSPVEPASSKRRDIRAAKRADALLNRLFIEPVLGLGYPQQEVPVLQRLSQYMQANDERNMQFDFDFIGLQNYTREIAAYSLFTPYLHSRLIPAAKRDVPVTAMGWEIYPQAIYRALKQYSAYPQIKKIYITENGAAFTDNVQNGRVHDRQRTEYLQEHIGQVLRAKQEGCKVNGYFVWTLTDNFEWAEGYHPRFGLVYVDFETQQRIIKDSGKWYGEFLGG